MNLLINYTQQTTYLGILIVGVVIGSSMLTLWFYQRHRLYKTPYFKKTNLNLWEHFKRNIALVAGLFFYVIAISAIMMGAL